MGIPDGLAAMVIDIKCKIEEFSILPESGKVLFFFFPLLTQGHNVIHVNLCNESSKMNQEYFVLAT